MRFDWDENKSMLNKRKHGISFAEAKYAFVDKKRVILRDRKHSGAEERFFCFGKCKRGIITVRFTYRNSIIRIFGAGKWRHGKKIYEKKNKDSAL